MQTARFNTLVFALLIVPASAAAQMPAGKTFTLSGELLRGYQQTQQNLAEAAEKMPGEHYGFKPTPDIKPFGQLVAHVALIQFSTCAMLKNEASPRKDEKEETTRTKTEAIALLKASADYCEPLVTALGEPAMSELTKSGDNQVAKGLVPISLIAHGGEMYGTMAVYLRLKGIVPPTTERRNQMTKKNP